MKEKNFLFKKLNDKNILYKTLQIWYENVSDATFKEILNEFSQSIFENIFYNISDEDLKKLIELRKTLNYELKTINKDITISKSLNIISKTNKDIKEIINKNVKDFLEKKSYNMFEEIIY